MRTGSSWNTRSLRKPSWSLRCPATAGKSGPRSPNSLFVLASGAWPSRESRADTGGRTRGWGAVRGAPWAAATRSGTCGRSSWSPSPAQHPRLAPRADWPPAGNKGRNMQIGALSQSGPGRGGAALGRRGGSRGRERVTRPRRGFLGSR